MLPEFAPIKSLADLENEVNAAIHIATIANVQEDKFLATILGLVMLSTGINCLELLDKALDVAMHPPS